MDIRFLKSLVAVIETGSIAAAARRENLTAPAVSQRIQALERTLCCALLNRSAHSVEPSEQCQALLPKIHNLIQSAAALRDELDINGVTGDFKLGAISTALTGILPELMSELTLKAPQLRLRITPGDSRRLYEQVVSCELDAGIMVRPPFTVPKSISMHVLRIEPLMLLTKEAVNQTDVKDTLLRNNLIRYDSNAWGGQIALQYLNDNDLDPDLLCNLDALDAIHIMVEKGMGVSLVPFWAGLKSDGVNALSIPDAAPYARQVVLLHRATPRRPRALAALIEILEQKMPSELTEPSLISQVLHEAL